MKDLKFIVLTNGWDCTPWYGMSIAHHLQQEGYDVTVGYEDNYDAEDKTAKLTQFDGILKKHPIKTLVKALKQLSNKDEYFVYCDHSELYEYATELTKAGFKNGLFPTEKDCEFEKDRELAMEFVRQHYTGIKLIPFNEFSKIDDAKKFIDENPDVYVLQSKGDHVSTIVPTSDVPELAAEQIKNQMDKNKSDYEKGGLILKKKLINPIEITPQIMFYNGEPVFTDLDIETKNIGDGNNNGDQVGCGSNLIIKTEFDDKLNKIAFPQVVYDMAKEHVGMFVWDISLYITPDGIYFGEFCANRLGFDASMTEMCMSDGAGEYFEKIMEGENPLEKTFGVALRLFNLGRSEDINIAFKGIEEYVWLYDVKIKDLEMVSTGACWDLGVITASGDTIESAIDKLFAYKDKFVFKEMYSRTKNDFNDYYHTSILDRFAKINHKFIEAPDTKEVQGIREELQKEYDSKLEKEVLALKDALLPKIG